MRPLDVHRRARQLLLALFAAPAALPGQARPDTVRADTARTLRPVEVTETRAVGTAGGASAVVVKTEGLRSSPAPVLEEALRESPFVHVRQNSRGEMELSIRGSDSRQAAVLLDGVPLSIGWDHRVDPSLVPLTGAQNLVIVRGLSTVLGGPNTLGGTIEVTHDDALTRLGPGRVWGGAGVDEHGALVASVGGGREAPAAQGRLTIRGGVAHRRRAGFALPQEVADSTARDGLRTNSDLRETDAFASARWHGAMGRSLGVMLSGFDAERGVPPEEHLAQPRLWRYPLNRRALIALAANAGMFATPFGFGTLDAGAGYNGGRLRIHRYDDREYDTITGTETGDERTLSARVRASHTLPVDGRLTTAVTLANVDYAETIDTDPTAKYRQRLWSAGAELELPVRGGTVLSSGVVYDRAATPKTGGRSPQPPMDAVGWRAGMTHDVNAHWRLHASASRRARFPSLRELYSGALDRFQPNPDLEPETLVGLESGITMDRPIGPLPDATLQVNAFRHVLRGAVVRTTLPPPDQRFLRVNRDRVQSTGVELLAGVAFGARREEAVTLTGDALLQRVRLSAPSAGDVARHPENNPETRGMLELGVPLPAGVRGYANARFTGRQYCLNAETGTEMSLDARTETSLAAERRFVTRAARAVRLLLALDNAADVAIYDQCGLPQPGRTLRLMVSFH